MKKVIILFFAFLPVAAFAQTGMILSAMIVGNDTFPAYELQDVVVVSKRIFKDQLEQYRFNQLKRNVMVVYPYAKEAGGIFRSINDTLPTFEKKKDRNKFVNKKEEELDRLFEDDLKNLTVAQGEILTKLVARETSMSVYNLIREFKNPLSAFYWNKMSQFLGYSLRYEYDPQQEKDIELIVRSIEGDYY